MIQIAIVSIGKTNEAYVKAGLEKYIKLIGKYAKLEWIELNDVKNGNKLSPDKLKIQEAELLEAHLNDKAAWIFLDEIGIQLNSVDFASYLEKKSIQNSKLCFIIGGSYGLADSIKKKGEAIALSKLTFNHQMVRLILTEQIFRAFTILKGTTYHH
jgi:23S rRNA (pseudouridine1915-N3)-methyltransferase